MIVTVGRCERGGDIGVRWRYVSGRVVSSSSRLARGVAMRCSFESMGRRKDAPGPVMRVVPGRLGSGGGAASRQRIGKALRAPLLVHTRPIMVLALALKAELNGCVSTHPAA